MIKTAEIHEPKDPYEYFIKVNPTKPIVVVEGVNEPEMSPDEAIIELMRLQDPISIVDKAGISYAGEVPAPPVPRRIPLVFMIEKPA